LGGVLPHIQTEGNLFEAVQLGRLFPDSKTFVDATPKLSPEEIQRRYDDLLASGARFDLRLLLNEWFEIPLRTKAEHPRAKDAPDYIEKTWSTLTRSATNPPPGSTMLRVPNPFIVPGGRFDECFYWDSYFTALGLIKCGRTDLAEQIADNLVHLQQTVGLIPNGSRTYLASRSQPPVLSLLIRLLPDPARYLDALLREHTFWTQPERNSIIDGVPLAHYWDAKNTPREESFAEDVATNGGDSRPCDRFRHLRAGAESGWDFSSRWQDDPHDLSTIRCADVIPIDLNALLVLLEHTIAALADKANRKDLVRQFRQAAIARTAVLRERCFDEANGWFCDLKVVTGERRPQLSLAGVTALVANIADDKQAAAMNTTMQQRFLAPGGLRTTLVNTEQQWDGKNGWAPLQWWAIEGLRSYGYDTEANEVATRWINTCNKGFERDGVLMEKYDVENPSVSAAGGEYESQEGFGWTNGVYLALTDTGLVVESDAGSAPVS
jgi:alpha,alpha-trehalase